MVVYADRESIWSVARGAKKWYFALFVAQVAVGLVLVLYREVKAAELAWSTSPLKMWQDLAPVSITSAASSITLTEIGAFIVVLSRGLAEHFERRRGRRREALRQEGREEGRKAIKAWEEWNERRLVAQAAGEPFDEPPPGSTNDDTVAL